MLTQYKNFDINHISDNEANYFAILASLVENIDKAAYLTVDRGPNGYLCRISTEHNVVDHLIKQLNYLNNSISLKCVYSKSSKAGNIFFKIPI